MKPSSIKKEASLFIEKGMDSIDTDKKLIDWCDIWKIINNF